MLLELLELLELIALLLEPLKLLLVALDVVTRWLGTEMTGFESQALMPITFSKTASAAVQSSWGCLFLRTPSAV
ncbi:MAG: hypothetical protein ICV60_09825 [Pyrinomonadaceae bacterium]|nr:hypothetical protein [Pyrinomonadaceae bacterium]